MSVWVIDFKLPMSETHLRSRGEVLPIYLTIIAWLVKSSVKTSSADRTFDGAWGDPELMPGERYLELWEYKYRDQWPIVRDSQKAL